MISTITMAATRNLGAIVLLVASAALAGCAGVSLSTAPEPVAGAQIPRAPTPPPFAIAGRWTLASPGKGQCAMTFGGTAGGATEGTIAPEGGCPGNFFTSRKWVFDHTGLSIRNHKNEALAQLAVSGNRFDGHATSGEPITLSR
jgi:Protease inhibitor Inh